MIYTNGKWTEGKGASFSSFCPVNNKLIWDGDYASNSKSLMPLVLQMQLFQNEIKED